ncbi:MAG: DUF86 domain-containing protein [Myxococcota bacterium]
MTDPPLVAKKLARIEQCVAELRRHADVDRLARDVVMQRFVEHTLQIAIQSALDVASHIASSERLGEPATNHALFDLLAKGGWLAPEAVPTLRAMVGFRNIIVHEYDDVDLQVVREVVAEHLDDLLAFVAAIRQGLAG